MLSAKVKINIWNKKKPNPNSNIIKIIDEKPFTQEKNESEILINPDPIIEREIRGAASQDHNTEKSFGPGSTLNDRIAENPSGFHFIDPEKTELTQIDLKEHKQFISPSAEEAKRKDEERKAGIIRSLIERFKK